MEIAHYVLVNFLSWQAEWDRKLDDPLLEKQRLSTLERYLLPGLENQTDRDFTLFLYIGEQLSNKAREHLAGLKTTFPVKFGEYRVLKQEMIQAWAHNDIVITSKMADDDIPWKGASAEVKRIAREGLPFVVHGYRRGLVYVEGKGITKWRYPNDQGQLAIFMSLIRRTDGPPMTINDLGSHGAARINAQIRHREFGVNQLPEGWWNSDDTTDPAWVYVRHENAIFGKREKFKDLDPDLTPLRDFGWKPESI